MWCQIRNAADIRKTQLRRVFFNSRNDADS